MKNNQTRILFGRMTFLVLAIMFTLSVTVQIFLAGMAIFVSPENWVKHIIFVHLFGFNIPVLMLIFAIVGVFPRWVYWQLFGVLVLIFLMYFTANITGALPWAGALHPVIAVVLFILSCSIVLRVWKLISANKKGEE
ncbi:hypothetical protein SAMN04488072_106170 [Lentibacillus halodurans]|uniref:Uncharacterized protein n=1 Tax=Lentibacillus halodurans TaxID=237679 RepID=A0A1I0Y0B5_9BACI|nr:DUF6220 domain-containing protein [Lentibacillus halodurans]SFB06761.1 hypothetical protein SAMN04488072_106170 [Lentibacillus halodurans]